MRNAYGSITHGFIPLPNADPLVNLTTKHGIDERVRLDDLAFQTDAATHIARTIGSLGTQAR